MRNSLLLFLVPVALCSGQVSAVVTLSNGIQLRIYAQAAEGTPVALKTDLQPASGDSFYRIYRDENNLAVFAYEVEVERSADGTQFRITARPAGTEFAERFPNADGGKPTPTLPDNIQSQLLDSGGQFSIDIPTDPGLKQTIHDTVQIQLNRRGQVEAEAGAQQALLRFVALRVYIGGKLASGGGAGAVVSGRYAMFYIPGRGGYFFSSEPVTQRPFVQIGVVDGAKLTFTVDNLDYLCQSDVDILSKAARGQIWVYHDANYQPAGNWTKTDPEDRTQQEFFTAASDSLNWWLP